MAVSENIQSPSPNASNPLAAARDAAAVAHGLRSAAEECSADQPALRTRLIVAAATIDALCELLIRAVAKRAGKSRTESAHALLVVRNTLDKEDFLILHLALDRLERFAHDELAKIGNSMKASPTVNLLSRTLIVRGKLQRMENAQ